MGWTDDSDTEGLIEENPFIFIALGIVGIAVAGILYFVGIDYNPNWFEGQAIISSIGILFLLIFIPSIAISTLTGKSDLVKWEALFLIISTAMIFIGNDFDFSKFMQSFNSQISGLGNTQINQVLMTLVIIVGIAIAFATGSGNKVSIGAILTIVILLAIIGFINMWNAGTFDNFSTYIQDKGWAYALGKGLSDFTGGLGDGVAGKGIGIGCLAIGLIFVILPGKSTAAGIILIIIGTGILGPSAADSIKDWLSALKGEKGSTEQFKASIVAAGLIGAPAFLRPGYKKMRKQGS